MFTVTLGNSQSFECQDGNSILESAMQNQMLLEYSCKTGRCRSCLAKVESGETVEIAEETILSEEEKKDGYILTCISTPISNISLDIHPLDKKYHIPKRIIPAKINDLEYFSKNLLKLSLRLPPDSNFLYNNGQYINLLYKELSRSYSISSTCEPKSAIIEFYIRNYEGGEMSNYLFKRAKINDLLRIEGPFGTFYHKEEIESKNLIFLATGTGLAPIKSIIQGFDKKQIKKYNISVFHGVRHYEDLFWKPKSTSIKYFPVLSKPDIKWTGELGYIQDVVLKQKFDLKESIVYACGSAAMINSAKEVLIKNGLEKSNFFSDAFVKSI